MENPYRRRRARLNPKATAVLLASLSVLVFLYLSADCFLSSRVYDLLHRLLPAALATVFLFGFTLVIRGGYKAKWSAMATFLRAGGLGLALTLMSFLLGYVGTMLIVYLTSWHTTEFTSPLHISSDRGRCGNFITFYNRPIEREVTTCSGRWSTDVLVFRGDFVIEERVGPLGVRLIEIRH